MFSFGTPSKDRIGSEFLNSAGKSVNFMQSPQDFGKSPIESDEYRKTMSPSKSLYDNYPCKGPNQRLIDIKNSTWKTKSELANHGKHLQGKMLYTLGPREAYVVDKIFDKETNYYDLGKLSHGGEMIYRQTGDKTYNIEHETDYNNEHDGSISKITKEMRERLHDEMTKEHEIVLSSPKKYQR
jgi:hypothetical protein